MITVMETTIRGYTANVILRNKIIEFKKKKHFLKQTVCVQLISFTFLPIVANFVAVWNDNPFTRFLFL